VGTAQERLSPTCELRLRLAHPAVLCELFRPKRNSRSELIGATKQPDRQITKSLSSLSQKNKSLSRSGKSVI
jgi:hypothetical protein